MMSYSFLPKIFEKGPVSASRCSGDQQLQVFLSILVLQMGDIILFGLQDTSLERAVSGGSKLPFGLCLTHSHW